MPPFEMLLLIIIKSLLLIPNQYLSFFLFRQPEVQILDYVTQQYKIFPHIATCFAIKVTASCVWDMYNTVQSQLHHSDYEKLPEVGTFIPFVVIYFSPYF